MINDYQGRLLTLFNQQLESLKELHRVLLDECEALKQRDTTLIEALAEKKHQLLNIIAELDNKRQIHTDNLPHDAINILFDDNQIVFIKNEIDDLLQQCRHQNQINGGIIEINQLFCSKVLDIVRGEYGDNELYGASGKNLGSHTAQSLARI